LEGQINELRQENADLRVKIGRLSGRVKYLRSLTKELSGGRMVKATTWLTVYPLEDGKDLIDAIKHGIVLNDSVVFTDPALTQIANRTACCDETVTKYIKIYKDVKEIN
ncbi:MAG: hypothetical protein JO370_08995, partial [Paucibacter sp.]|nr:hypothetical protein [Roseateles sp.]